MPFGKRTQRAAPVPLTAEQRVARHEAAAEDLLVRAGKAGRVEAETRLAAMATAHAVLALLGFLRLQSRQTGPAVDPSVDAGEDDDGS